MEILSQINPAESCSINHPPSKRRQTEWSLMYLKKKANKTQFKTQMKYVNIKYRIHDGERENLFIVKFQRAIGITSALVDETDRLFKINNWSLSRAKHEPNDTTAHWKKDIKLYSCFYPPSEEKKTWIAYDLPRVCWYSCPRIVDRSLEYLTADGDNVFNYVHMKPYALCLCAYNSTRTKCFCNRLEEWFLK